jgi:hypothetical protein
MAMRDLTWDTKENGGGKLGTCRLVFRVRFDCALSCFDSYALERRLWNGLLLRHPQVSNQNSKRADSIRREREWTENAILVTSTTLFQRHPSSCRFRQCPPIHHQIYYNPVMNQPVPSCSFVPRRGQTQEPIVH